MIAVERNAWFISLFVKRWIILFKPDRVCTVLVRSGILSAESALWNWQAALSDVITRSLVPVRREGRLRHFYKLGLILRTCSPPLWSPSVRLTLSRLPEAAVPPWSVLPSRLERQKATGATSQNLLAVAWKSFLLLNESWAVSIISFYGYVLLPIESLDAACHHLPLSQSKVVLMWKGTVWFGFCVFINEILKSNESETVWCGTPQYKFELSRYFIIEQVWLNAFQIP